MRLLAQANADLLNPNRNTPLLRTSLIVPDTVSAIN